MSFHEFRAAPVDTSKCLFCNLAESDHVCSVCSKTGLKLDKMAGMLFCEPCKKQEEIAWAENQKHAEERVIEVKTRIPEPDTTIQVTTDIFNSHIAAIEEWRKEIDATIVGEQARHEALAFKMQERYLHLKTVIEAGKAAQAESRTIQTYYNDISKKIREEIRAQIKIADVQYHPPEKPVKAPKIPSLKKTNRAEIREASQLSGIPESVLTILCNTRNMSVKDAIQFCKQVESDSTNKE
jgi:hypothetical protein